MASPRPIRSIYLLIVLASAGCHQGQPRVVPDGFISTGPAPTILPVVPADDLVTDLLRRSITPPAKALLGGAPALRNHRGLELSECVTLAARNSPLASSFDAKRSALPCDRPRSHFDLGKSKGQANKLLATALALQADEVRNQDAGKAAEAFFRLAQAEAQEAVVRRSEDEVRAALGAARDQIERGLPAQDVHNKLRRQEVELRGKRIKLGETIDRLSLGLRETLILAPDDADWLVRPLVDWQSSPDIPDAEYAVSVGLANRAQLRLLRTIMMEIDQASLPVAANLLATIHPLLGIMAPKASHFAPVAIAIAAKLQSTEPEAVSQFREQARRILAWRERAIEAEIRDAVLGVLSHVHLVSVARDQYGLRDEELNRLLAKADHGLTPSLELSTARLDLFAAESLWIDEVSELRVQQVRLEQAQGLLATPALPPFPSAPVPFPSAGMPMNGSENHGHQWHAWRLPSILWGRSDSGISPVG
jgi:hypothetical protein